MISNLELYRILTSPYLDKAELFIDGELPCRNMYIRKTEIIVLEVDGTQYHLDREEFYNDVVIWNFNKSQITFKPLSKKLDELYETFS
jgi:hypothetical protein